MVIIERNWNNNTDTGMFRYWSFWFGLWLLADIDLCPAHNFFWFDIGLLYLAHECITMRRFMIQILNFDLKVKFTGFLTCFRVRPITIFGVDIGLPFLAHGCIIIRWCVAYIRDPDTTLNVDLNVTFIEFWTCFCVRPIAIFIFLFTLAYHIWHIGLSPWEYVTCTFMLPIHCWPLTSKSNL